MTRINRIWGFSSSCFIHTSIGQKRELDTFHSNFILRCIIEEKGNIKEIKKTFEINRFLTE